MEELEVPLPDESAGAPVEMSVLLVGCAPVRVGSGVPLAALPHAMAAIDRILTAAVSSASFRLPDMGLIAVSFILLLPCLHPSGLPGNRTNVFVVEGRLSVVFRVGFPSGLQRIDEGGSGFVPCHRELACKHLTS